MADLRFRKKSEKNINFLLTDVDEISIMNFAAKTAATSDQRSAERKIKKLKKAVDRYGNRCYYIKVR